MTQKMCLKESNFLNSLNMEYFCSLRVYPLLKALCDLKISFRRRFEVIFLQIFLLTSFAWVPGARCVASGIVARSFTPLRLSETSMRVPGGSARARGSLRTCHTTPVTI